MIFTASRIEGAWIVDPAPHVDERGRFMRAWCREEFAAHGIDFAPVQANMGHSIRRGTMRGLHYQRAPAPEAKFVRCTRGAMFSVVADLRPASPSRWQWQGVELTADNGRALLVPAGCAHGCLSLADATDFHYMVSGAFSPADASGVRYDDPVLGIAWPMPVQVVSPQDRAWPLLESCTR